jgi:Excalibur calcium-binding domain
MGLSTFRHSKKARLWVIGILIIVGLAALYLVKGVWFKVAIGTMVALLMLAFGMEVKNTDFDVVKLVKTGSFAASAIQRDEKGDLLQGSIDAFCVAAERDYNCPDFKTQSEAQTVYNRCVGLGQNMDVYRLDGDKDGVVCEALRK